MIRKNDRASSKSKSSAERAKADPHIVDRGWDDYLPPDPQEVAARRRAPATRRNFKQPLFHGRGPVIRFVLFAFVLAALVVGGMYFVARPVVADAVVDWAAENPTALQIPFVADIVRGELHEALDRPVDPSDKQTQVVVIGEGESAREIGDQLVQAGIISDARAFVFESIEKGVTGQFQVGRHVVSRSMTVDQILAVLIAQPSRPPTVRVTFREGLRIEQMVAKLEDLEANPPDPTAPLTMSVKDFYRLATDPPADLLARYPWLSLPPGASLEGFLFPATYDIDPNTTPDELLTLLLDAFANHAPPGLLDLPSDKIYRTVQLASLVETEAKVDTDRPLIAGVYANRLNSKLWPTQLLDSDPTLNYANDSVWLGEHDISTWVTYTFWTSVKTDGKLSQVVFPGKLAQYNTYHYAGLPPSPICSPSAASLVAAMSPDTSEGYLYFVAKNDGSGTHAFARTAAEQQANLKKYGYLP